MKLTSRIHQTLAIALLASTALLAIAPAAEAGDWRRYKRVRHHRHDRHVQRVVVRESGAGPVLAGLIGGFILGSAVSANARPVVVHEREVVSAPRYRYWDAYCDEWFVSLSDAREHAYRHHHPVRVKVFHGDECQRTLRWDDGAWYDCGDHDDDEDWRD